MKTPYDNIFDKLRFTDDERIVFMNCIDEIKRSQENGTNALEAIIPEVRKLADNEI